MKKIWIFVGVVIAIAIGFYTLSPLFINRTVDEPIPENIAIDAYNKFETYYTELIQYIISFIYLHNKLMII